MQLKNIKLLKEMRGLHSAVVITLTKNQHILLSKTNTDKVPQIKDEHRTHLANRLANDCNNNLYIALYRQRGGTKIFKSVDGAIQDAISIGFEEFLVLLIDKVDYRLGNWIKYNNKMLRLENLPDRLVAKDHLIAPISSSIGPI